MLMDTYTPLFSKIVDSSVWTEADYVCKVFITLLAVKDRDQVARVNAFEVGRKCWPGDPEAEKRALDALNILAAPDTKRIEPQPFDGRRIEKVERGWLVLNGEHYRELARRCKHREDSAQHMARKRASSGNGSSASEYLPSQPPAPRATTKIPNGPVMEIYEAYPKRVGKPAAIKAITKALVKIKPEDLLEKTRAFAAAKTGSDPQFIPHPATWFNQERFNDDPETWRQSVPAGPSGKPLDARSLADKILDEALNTSIPEIPE